MSLDKNELLEYLASLEVNVMFDRKVQLGFLYMFNRIIDYPAKQTRHIQESELDVIKSLSENGYLLSEIAIICGRSKSSIHEALNRIREETTIQQHNEVECKEVVQCSQ